MEAKKRPIRVLVAKPGLDGHDRGARVIVQGFRDAGMEVIYTGLRQTVEQIVRATVQEDVDIIGLSILSGSHLGLTQKLMNKLREEGIQDRMVIAGGTIPEVDIPKLKAMGVAQVFPTGTPFKDAIEFVVNNIGRYRPVETPGGAAISSSK